MTILIADKTELEQVRNLRDKGDLQAAHNLLALLHKQSPGDPRIWHEQAMVLMVERKYREALSLLHDTHGAFTIIEGTLDKMKEKRKAREERARTAYHAGICAGSLGDPELSENWFTISSELDPTPESLSSLGSTRYMNGDWTKGFLAHDKALRCESRGVVGDFAKSMIRMMRGEIEGFKEYESRFSLPRMAPHRQVDLPRWTGVEVGRVLVVSEQGFGDSIMMERYLKHIPDYLVSVQSELKGWFSSRGHGSVNNEWPIGLSHVTKCDYWVPMLSLPSIFGILPPQPLLRGDSIAGADIRFQGNSYRVTPRIGLCWQGNREQTNDRDRSGGGILQTLWDSDYYNWVSLTYGERGFHPKDFLETARLIETLDAVVTTDTAVCHMAGTLGVPTYVLTASNPEWRWGVPREIVEKTPWYPSMTLIRRKEMRAWPEAMETVSKLLKEML